MVRIVTGSRFMKRVDSFVGLVDSTVPCFRFFSLFCVVDRRTFSTCVTVDDETASSLRSAAFLWTFFLVLFVLSSFFRGISSDVDFDPGLLLSITEKNSR